MPETKKSNEAGVEDLTSDTALKNAVENAKAVDDANLVDDDEIEDDATDEDVEDNSEDDSADDDSEDPESDDDDEGDEDDSEDDLTAKERKFKNLAAEDDAGYIKNLENAYGNSTTEAVRLRGLNTELTKQMDSVRLIAQNDPALAERLKTVLGEGGSGASTGLGELNPNDQNVIDPNEDPFIVHNRTEWQKKSREEVAEILDANPDIATDPEISDNVKHWMEIFANEHYKKNRELMSGGEAMKAAMKHLGIEDEREKQNVADKVKDLGAPNRRSKGRKPKSTNDGKLTEGMAKFADNLGLDHAKVAKQVNK